jgi:transcriptional regulator with XRE-family HTH domain
MGPQLRRARVSEGGPDQIDVEVGLNLRRMRLARGFSQTELGNALGVSFQQIQKYERGANRLSASMLVKAARFLAIPSADLLPPDDDVRPMPDFVNRFSEVRGVPELVDSYCTLRNPALRNVLLQLLRAMNGKGGGDAKPMTGEATADSPQ